MKKLEKKTRDILNALGSHDDTEISITLVDDQAISQLNEKYLNKKGPTNVISFAMSEGEFSEISPHLLGDVIISMDTAEKERKKSGITLEERLTQLLVHGILHLFGYDHERSEDDEIKMEKKSLELIRQIEGNQDLNFF